MYSAVLTDTQAFQLAPLALPALPEGGALLSLLGCGFCGSDLDKVINQKAQPGSVLGHEVVGTLLQLSPSYGGPFKVGDRVACAHHVPCQTCHYCVHGSESMCQQFKSSNFRPGGFSQVIALSNGHLSHTVFAVPSHITDAVASCVEPLACVVQAIEKTRFQNRLPASVAVIGLGFIGLMAAQVYQQEGSRVYGLDIQPTRLSLAENEAMVHRAFHSQAHWQALQETLETESPTGKVDLVFLSVVNQATLDQALSLVRDGGTIVLFTSPTRPEVSLSPNTLYFREITVIPSYSPSLASLKRAAELIFQNKINLAPLNTHVVHLDELTQGMRAYQTGEAIKVFVQGSLAISKPTAQAILETSP